MPGCRVLNVAQGIAALQSGKILAYPTEGVWGLGCRPDRLDAVRRLLEIKRRDPSKGLILIAACCADLEPYVQPLTEDQRERLECPGAPVTWLVPAAATSELLRGEHATQAVRITHHALCRALCRQAGPLVSTSANRQGCPPARSADEVRDAFGASLDGIVEGALGASSGPSEIRDLATGAVVRQAGTA